MNTDFHGQFPVKVYIINFNQKLPNKVLIPCKYWKIAIEQLYTKTSFAHKLRIWDILSSRTSTKKTRIAVIIIIFGLVGQKQIHGHILTRPPVLPESWDVWLKSANWGCLEIYLFVNFLKNLDILFSQLRYNFEKRLAKLLLVLW